MYSTWMMLEKETMWSFVMMRQVDRGWWLYSDIPSCGFVCSDRKRTESVACVSTVRFVIVFSVHVYGYLIRAVFGVCTHRFIMDVPLI